MEQHKLREELQKRSIAPSQNSWEQLSNQLDTHEKVQKGNKWGFLKYAAAILLLISVGFYFFQPSEKIIEDPIIVQPTIKEDFNKIKKAKELIVKPEIRVAETSNNKKETTVQKNQPIINQPKTNKFENESTAFNNIETELQPSKTTNIETVIVEMPTEEILIVNQPSEEEILDAEVEQLLKASKIKLTVNRQMSSKRVVSANALLNDVEEDLDKDFKEKLIESIVTTLKKPRKVVITDRGN